MRRAAGCLLAGGAACLLLLLSAGPPAAAVRRLRAAMPEPGAGTAPDQTAPLLALIALLAWALTAWLALCVALTAAAHLPGVAGRAGTALAHVCVPRVVRGALEAALGLSVALAGVSPTAAAAMPPALPAPAPAPPEPAVSLDWGGSPAAPVVAAQDLVVVRPGDTLWGLAEHDLAARQGRPPSAAEIARAWPSWWAVNRQTVGADPDLIHPGTQLSPPPR